jgi:hypothetical protein
VETASLVLSVVGTGVAIVAIVVTYLLYESAKDQATRAEGLLADVSDVVRGIEARQSTLSVTDVRELLPLFASRVLQIGTLGTEAEAAMRDLLVEAMERAGIRSNEEIAARREQDEQWFQAIESHYGEQPLTFAVLRRVRQLCDGREPARVKHVSALLVADGLTGEISEVVAVLAESGNVICDGDPADPECVLYTPA